MKATTFSQANLLSCRQPSEREPTAIARGALGMVEDKGAGMVLHEPRFVRLGGSGDVCRLSWRDEAGQFDERFDSVYLECCGQRVIVRDLGRGEIVATLRNPFWVRVEAL